MTRSIQIIPVLNGWYIRVGCQNLVFSDLNTMTSELNRYFKDPDGVEAEYLKNYKNKTVPQNFPPILGIENQVPAAPCQCEDSGQVAHPTSDSSLLRQLESESSPPHTR